MFAAVEGDDGVGTILVPGQTRLHVRHSGHIQGPGGGQLFESVYENLTFRCLILKSLCLGLISLVFPLP